MLRFHSQSRLRATACGIALALVSTTPAVAALPASASSTYSVRAIPELESYGQCHASTANAHGDIALHCDHQPLVWLHGELKPISLTPHASQHGNAVISGSTFTDMNDRGEIAGFVTPQTMQPVWAPMPARWTTSQELQLSKPYHPSVGTGQSHLHNRINNEGTVLLGDGCRLTTDGEERWGVCLWAASASNEHEVSMVHAPGGKRPKPPGVAHGISDQGSIVGETPRRGYRWEPTGQWRLYGSSDPKLSRSRATDISPSGEYVVGVGVFNENQAQPYLVRGDNEPTLLPRIGEEDAWYPVQVSDDGVVVHPQALLRVTDQGIQIDDLSAPEGLAEGEQVKAVNVADDGRVVANLCTQRYHCRVAYLIPQQP